MAIHFGRTNRPTRRLGEVVFELNGKKFMTTNTYYSPSTEEGEYDDLKVYNPMKNDWVDVPWVLEEWIIDDLGGEEALIKACAKAYDEVVDD